jgi:hypothetical protein
MQDAALLWKRTTPFTIVAKMLLDLGISYLSSLQVQYSETKSTIIFDKGVEICPFPRSNRRCMHKNLKLCYRKKRKKIRAFSL